ncbi:unnamed protein product [Ostreobium quekettii]|uniref:NADH dehydrogenase [ubiquinone] 1 alpha subcomplex assembly factor 3 n=1 Tax=Ostreobium quekettii TaxID=121088 RepID=A0A8S1IR15_9CHLO|nr:unnamed protein product [Ostreobium quekettii]
MGGLPVRSQGLIPGAGGRAGRGAKERGFASGLDTTDILDTEQGLLTIDGYSQHGFSVQGIQIVGGVLAFQDLWLQWRPETPDKVTPESLALLQLVRPLPELLVFGMGPEMRRLPDELALWLRRQEVDVEAMATVSGRCCYQAAWSI